jgi:hypothetical protein
MDSNYPFGIFKLFLLDKKHTKKAKNKKQKQKQKKTKNVKQKNKKTGSKSQFHPNDICCLNISRGNSLL